MPETPESAPATPLEAAVLASIDLWTTRGRGRGTPIDPGTAALIDTAFTEAATRGYYLVDRDCLPKDVPPLGYAGVYLIKEDWTYLGFNELNEVREHLRQSVEVMA
jgi:hypothetical protein